MCFIRHPVQRCFQANGLTLQQTGKVKFKNIHLCRNAPPLPISCTKTEVVHKNKAFVFRSLFVPILTCNHECWKMNKSVRSRLQAAEMGFMQKTEVYSYSTRIKALTFVNLLTSNRYYFA